MRRTRRHGDSVNQHISTSKNQNASTRSNGATGGRSWRARSRPVLALGLIACLLLSAAPLVSANTSSASTTNSTPVINNVFFYGSDPAAGSGAACASAGKVTSFNPTAGSTTALYVCVEASDGNGYEDICDSAASSALDLRTFSATNSADGSISDVSHPKTDVALTCATGSGTSVALTGSFQMEYWRPWGNAASSTAYKVTPAIKDVAGASAAAVVGRFDYTNLTSLDAATTGAISLGGALAPGDTGTEAVAAIYNKGNTAFTIHVSGTALTGSGKSQTIAVGNLKWATSASVAYATKSALTGTSATTSLSAPAETADGTTARNVYLQLAAPSGSSQWMPADTYSGTVTFATS